MVSGGKPLAMLDKIRAKYPMVMHGVSMSIGAVNGLNVEYLKKASGRRDAGPTMDLSPL